MDGKTDELAIWTLAARIRSALHTRTLESLIYLEFDYDRSLLVRERFISEITILSVKKCSK